MTKLRFPSYQLTAVLLLVLVGVCFGDWERSYHGFPTVDEEGYSVVAMPDSGAMFLGPFNYLRSPTTLVRTNKMGDTLWTSAYAGGYCRSIISFDDTGLAVAGSHVWYPRPDSYATSGLLVIFKPSGDTVWSRIYNDIPGITWFTCLSRTADRGYYLAGVVDTTPDWSDGCLITRVDSLGNILWSREYDIGPAARNSTKWIAALSDGGAILVGSSDFRDSSYSSWIMRIDERGDSLWVRNYGCPEWDYIEYTSVIPCLGGGFAVAGNSGCFYPTEDMKMSLFRLRENGSLLWEQEYRITPGIGLANSVIQISDRGFILVGEANTPDSTYPYTAPMAIVIRTDSMGYLIWSKTFGSPGWGRFAQVVPGLENNFFAVGTVCYGPVDSLDAYLVSFWGPDSQLLHIYPGWNLCSWSLSPLNPRADQVLPFALSTWLYVPSSRSYMAADTLRIPPEVGFWVLSDRETTVTVYGERVDSLVIPLYDGWNLCGNTTRDAWPSHFRTAPDSLLPLTTIFTFDPVTHSYVASPPDAGIGPGRGFWALPTRACTLFVR